MAPITESPEWRALDAHFDDDARRPPPRPVRRRPAARRAADRRGRRHLPRLLEAPHHRRDAPPARRAGRARAACATASTRCSAARRSTSPRTAPCCTSRCARPRARSIEVDGENVVPAVHAVLRKMADFSERVRCGAVDRPHRQARPQRRQHRHRWLRPRPAHGLRRARATSPQRDMTFRFVSNVDGTDFWEATHDLDPAETLFVVSSKTFTTLETLTNARTRTRRGSLAGLGGDESAVAKHFVAVSTNADGGGEVRHRHRQHVRVLGLGRRPLLVRLRHRPVADDRDRPRAVRARCSPASAAIDEHFRTAPFEREPARCCSACIGIWYDDFFGAETQAVLPVQPVPRPLPRVPAAARHGEQRQVGRPRRQPGHDADRARSCGASPAPTASTRSTNSSTRARSSSRPTSSGSCTPTTRSATHQDLLMANFFAQTEALAFGKTRDEVEAEGVPAHQVPHRTFAGNHPTNTILAERLTPFTLGQLVAIYEHKVFTQGTIWNINSFDQWGVELGKKLATAIIPELEPATDAARARPRQQHQRADPQVPPARAAESGQERHREPHECREHRHQRDDHDDPRDVAFVASSRDRRHPEDRSSSFGSALRPRPPVCAQLASWCRQADEQGVTCNSG